MELAIAEAAERSDHRVSPEEAVRGAMARRRAADDSFSEQDRRNVPAFL